MNVIIIEDEQLSAEHLSTPLKKVDKSIEVIGITDSVKKSIKLLSGNPQVNLLFVDIHLADGLSFEIFSKISIDTPIIFTTAYNDYAIKAFKVNSIDYLLKPLILKELQEAVKKVVHCYEQKTVVTNTANVDKNLVLINHSKGFTLIDYKDIVWLEASDNYTNIFLSNNNNKKIVASKTLKEFEAILPTNVFFRIHRSSLINIDYIKEYSNAEGGTIIMSDGTSIQVSKARSQEFSEFLKTRAVTPK